MRELAKFLYTHNPFYLISASCVLFGLRSMFDDTSSGNQIWQLAISLAAYTLLLTSTAIFIVRWGRVWEDARTVALLAILMCLALSVSFDVACNRQPELARIVLMGGLLFSILVVKFLEFGLPIALSSLYRIPLFFMLGLFFVFPIAVTSASWGLPSMAWRVLTFPFLCALSILLLIPAIRRGKEAVTNNGSPWPWPYYPWSIFFFMLIGMIGRSYLLTISFQMDRGMQSTFALFYLVPIAMAVILLFFEGAMKAGVKESASLLCVSLLAVVVASSIRGFSPVALSFHYEVTRMIGSPLWITTIACIGLAIYFGWRGAKSGYFVAAMLLVLCSGINRSTISLPEFHLQNPWPLGVLLVVQTVRVLRSRDSRKLLWAIVLANVVAAVAWSGELDSRHFLLALHISFVICVIGAFVLKDNLAHRLRAVLGAIVLPIVMAVSALAVLDSESRVLAVSATIATGLLAIGITALYKLSTWRLSCAMLGCLVCLLLLGRMFYQFEFIDGDRAHWSLLAGTLCFFCGTIVSATKAGLGSGIAQRIKAELRRAATELWG